MADRIINWTWYRRLVTAITRRVLRSYFTGSTFGDEYWRREDGQLLIDKVGRSFLQRLTPQEPPHEPDVR